jgi:septum site-determining protein MinC
MSAASNSAAPLGRPDSFELKSGQLPLVSLLLKSTDLAHLADEWDAHYGDNPGFFDKDPLVIDLSHLSDPTVPDFKALLTLLKRRNVCPMAVKGGNAQQLAAAVKAGLVVAQDVVLQHTPAPAESHPPAQPPPAPAPEAALAAPAAALPALVVDKPLRSGQQVYARGRDLVVMAMVNPGAEVIADGHIHVYAPLRGKAIAGARGNGDARIFAMSLEAELISIAGIYRTSDVPLPADVAGKPAMVSLQPGPDGEKLVMEPIKA